MVSGTVAEVSIFGDSAVAVVIVPPFGEVLALDSYITQTLALDSYITQTLALESKMIVEELNGR